MENKFSWISFYEELADVLINWEDKQGELIEFIEELRKKDIKVTPFV